MPNCLVIYQDFNENEFVEWAKNCKDRIIVINISNTIIEGGFFSDNITFKNMWDYYSFDELALIDKKANLLAQKWYIDNNLKDISNYQNISLGEVIQHEMMTFFVTCIRSVDIMSRIIDLEFIEKIVLFGCKTSYERAALHLGTKKKIKIEKRYMISEEYVLWEKNWFYPYDKISIKNLLRIFNFYAHGIKSKFKRLFRNIKNEKNYFMISPYRVVPLLKSMSKKNNVTVTMLVDGYLKDLKEGGITNDCRITLTPRWPFNALLKFKKIHIQRIANKIAKKGESLIRQNIADLPVDISDLISVDLIDYIEANIKNCIIDYYILKPYLSGNKFDMIILIHDFKGIHRLATAMGNHNNIHTLILQHGALGFFPYFISPISKTIGVWQEPWGEWFTNHLNVPQEKIIPIGEPFYDIYFDKRISKTDDLLNKYNIPKGKKVVLLSHQDMVSISALEFPGLNRKMALQFFETVRNMDDCFFIFKLRPGSNTDFGKKIVNAAKIKNVSLISKADNHELLSLCDVVVTRSSTQAFEAIILDKPVLLINFLQSYRYNNGEFNPFMQTDCTIVANTLEEIIPSLNSILYDDEIQRELSISRKSFINKFYIEGKNASEQLADFIANKTEQPQA